MSAQVEHEIVLYDLASTKNVCFSPVVWRIRMLLNYKQIPYKTLFLEFQDIEPTFKELGVAPPESASGGNIKYTVPVIYHVPTKTYLMDSIPISKFLEKIYPDPSIPLTSELGREIESKARSAVGITFSASLMPRELGILSPAAQEYFRRTREASLGFPLENLLDADREQKAWDAATDSIRAVDELIMTNKAEGPFVLGAEPSYTDFFIAGSLQCARVVHEKTFERLVIHPGYKRVYEACLPYMEKKD
ncbi:hypothetical protein BKA65DRAFT_487763 [Rhexocercosporidium sp. MPI-PUGE-AT-0058]|nr:hypothetical protein BKA65DRAFT_487763 [Rhexocercosporidium sp. MPI-PUGE-AT-0058]